MKIRMNSLLACVPLVAAAPAFAHHSFAAEYDAAKPVTLTGTVTKVEWTNPHARFYINVKNDDGTTTNWNFELASPNYLKRAGWSSASLTSSRPGSARGRWALTTAACPARPGSPPRRA